MPQYKMSCLIIHNALYFHQLKCFGIMGLTRFCCKRVREFYNMI